MFIHPMLCERRGYHEVIPLGHGKACASCGTVFPESPDDAYRRGLRDAEEKRRREMERGAR